MAPKTLIFLHDPTPPPPIQTVTAPPPLSYDESFDEAAAWEVIDAAVEMIAAHYLIDRDLVWATVLELEVDCMADSGLACFGRLMERPWGITALGIRVAQLLLGFERADEIPPMTLSYQ